MLFMGIETFPETRKVYARFAKKGHMAPDGIHYVGSWIAAWSDLAAFEVIPVVPSKGAAGIWGPPAA